jgi:hypothetical protein
MALLLTLLVVWGCISFALAGWLGRGTEGAYPRAAGLPTTLDVQFADERPYAIVNGELRWLASAKASAVVSVELGR